MAERDDWMVGALAARDAYRGAYPAWPDALPMPDARTGASVESLSGQAGIRDIGRRRYSQPGDVWEEQPEVAETGAALRGVTRMINPERFSDAVSRMPLSRNIEYGPPAKVIDRVKATLGVPQSFTDQMGSVADQGAYRGEYPWDAPPAGAPTRITVRPADSMYPAQEPDMVLPPSDNSALDIPRTLLPHLSRPETYGPRPPPTIEAGPGGKVPTGDPRMMGALADTTNMGLYNAIPFGGPLSAAGKAIILGIGARTAHMGMLAKAKEMALAGKTPSEIRRATRWPEGPTGWEQGADQQWGFEIPGVNARMRRSPGYELAPLSEHMQYPELYEAMPGVARIPTARMPPDYVKQQAERFGVDPEQIGGSYTPYTARKPPMILYNPKSSFGSRSVLIHEGGSHGVQQQAGFPSGAAPIDPASIVPGTPEWAIYQRNLRQMGVSRDAEARADAVFEAYQRSAGEQQAINAQTRMDMSVPELRATPSWKTQDWPYQKQIIAYNDYPRVPKQRAMGSTFEPLRTDPIVRGRSGRPIQTAPLSIGTEEAILAKGYERATGPRPPPGVEQPPFTQAAGRSLPTIAQSAVRIGDRTWTGPWHVAAYEKAADAMGVPVESLLNRHGGTGTEGFVTSAGKFVSREEAMDTAIRAGQISSDIRDAPWPLNKQLTSEHLAMFGLAGPGAMGMGALAAQNRYAQ
jgi:hypothetical protein